MLTKCTYQSQHTITFGNSQGELMVNATEMAKPFGKSPSHWLRNKDTREYLEAVKKRVANLQLVKSVHGDNGGTWLHQKLALRFAQWLSAEFAVWVDERIEELLLRGRTEMQPSSPLALARQMLEAMEYQEQRISNVEDKVKRVEAKVTAINEDYYTLAGYYVLKGQRFNLGTREAQQAGRRLSKESRDTGYEILRTHHPKYGNVGTYHIRVLEVVLGF